MLRSTLINGLLVLTLWNCSLSDPQECEPTLVIFERINNSGWEEEITSDVLTIDYRTDSLQMIQRDSVIIIAKISPAQRTQFQQLLNSLPLESKNRIYGINSSDTNEHRLTVYCEEGLDSYAIYAYGIHYGLPEEVTDAFHAFLKISYQAGQVSH